MHNLQIGANFPTPIAKTSNTKLAEEMLPVCRKILDDPKYVTNQWDYKNTYTNGEGIEVLPQIEKFKQYILSVGREFLTSIGYDPVAIQGRVPQIFTSQMNEKDSHGRHSHAGAILSGVFYLNVPHGSSPIMFYDPRPHRDTICLPIKADSEFNRSCITFHPMVGDLVIWESWLHHEVIPNNCKDRVTLVFNL
jgi:uncharacterized protein (TIGR02466 family)